jgi:phosphoribosylaminoimidazole (AIR) synthetase
MNMHMGRNVQAAGMGMQKRHQTLQERQNQKQAVIFGILSHGPHSNLESHTAAMLCSWQSQTRGVRM